MVASGESQHAQQNWRYCGGQIKLWREEAGVSRQDLTIETNYDYEYVKSMENGRRRPTLRLLQAADQMCGARGKLLAAHDFLKPEPFPARSQEYMVIEAEAIAVHDYALGLIPGLLQTEGYARALIGESCPPLDDETVEERVRARLSRQEALKRRAKTVYGFVVYEASLRTEVGGQGVMRQQLLHLSKVGETRNVSLQVLPFGKCGGLALNGSFVLLETTEHEHFAYVEGPETSVLHADADKVSDLTQVHGMIRMQALGVEESAEFIRKVAEEL
ncbi:MULTISPECIES: helix-turn-helix domain-containing protein [Streptomyces]|uniref:Transcriptional regulator n=1 Tax=Streptomyces dengpaensis TaxID=2049881 RepID=A0ABN5I160_9ACTN|nr:MULTISPECIES: helix-turn-helix transcriptional regulator [Streptomyces]AVH56984.1 transcriptional regulator [Streptomyces dengpaensis]PIB09115.1 transcriptional regulator [Streptomyces sp. HG99]